MPKFKPCLILLFCLGNLFVQAQNQHSGWLASFNTIGLNHKWSLHFDAQLRSTDELRNIQTLLLRPGINYHFAKNMTATLGYAFIYNRKTVEETTGYTAEHRIWEQFLISHKWQTVTTTHRFRLEQRFLPVSAVRNTELEVTDYVTAHRLRYFIRNLLPLQNSQAFTKGFFLALQYEVFLNTGNKKAVNGKTFDQNRFYAALGYRIHKIDLEAGYLNQYTKTATGANKNHIAQIAVYKRL